MGMQVHPDAALLILCGELSILQGEWQRLWAGTPEEGEPGPDDAAWEDYAQHVWPGVRRADADGEHDPVRDLIAMKATTIEGMRAKAAAIKAVDEASGYLMCCRDDSYELMLSLLTDVAGSAAMPVGEMPIRSRCWPASSCPAIRAGWIPASRGRAGSGFRGSCQP